MTEHNFDSECECEQCETFRDHAQRILDHAKEREEPKVWGGELLGWTTQNEIDALDEIL